MSSSTVRCTDAPLRFGFPKRSIFLFVGYDLPGLAFALLPVNSIALCSPVRWSVVPLAVCHARKTAMRYRNQAFSTREGWQKVARARSGAETPGTRSVGAVHPEGMTGFRGVFAVGGKLLDRCPGRVAPSSLC